MSSSNIEDTNIPKGLSIELSSPYGDFDIDEFFVNLIYKTDDDHVTISFNIGKGVFIEGFYSTSKIKGIGYTLLCWILDKIQKFKNFHDDDTILLLAMGNKEGKNRIGLFLYYYEMGFKFEDNDIDIKILQKIKDLPPDKISNANYRSLATEGELLMSSTFENILFRCKKQENQKMKENICKNGKMPISRIIVGNKTYIYPDKLPKMIEMFLSC